MCLFHQQAMEFSKAEMGRRLGRHRATVAREFKRFRKHPSWSYFHRYCPDSADTMAREHRAKPRGRRWDKNPRLKAYVRERLAMEWAPEQIAGRLVLDFPDDTSMRVSTASLYRMIEADRASGGTLWKQLRQSSKIRRKRYGSGARRNRIPDRVGIEQRPAEVESRETPGHWEADTVVCRNGRLATCVERHSRYVLIARLPDGTACEFNAAAIRCFRRIPRALRKTLTTDNGSEFIEHKKLGKCLGFKTYFANPYASWERGTNENTNGLIRQYVPKGADISGLTYQRVARIAAALNNRPRKCLGYRTPAEVLRPVLRL
jgi:IS30 family transposase